MDLNQLANLGEFVGGFAVLVTLVYLVLQVRQGNANARSTSRQALIDTWSDAVFEIGKHRDLTRIGGEGLHDFEGLSEDDRSQFTFLISKSVMNVYNGVLLHREGMLDRETLDFFAGFIASAIQCPGGAAWWASTPYPQAVKDYVEEFQKRNEGAIPPMDTYWGYWIRPWQRNTGTPLS